MRGVVIPTRVRDDWCFDCCIKQLNCKWIGVVVRSVTCLRVNFVVSSWTEVIIILSFLLYRYAVTMVRRAVMFWHRWTIPILNLLTHISPHRFNNRYTNSKRLLVRSGSECLLTRRVKSNQTQSSRQSRCQIPTYFSEPFCGIISLGLYLILHKMKFTCTDSSLLISIFQRFVRLEVTLLIVVRRQTVAVCCSSLVVSIACHWEVVGWNISCI